MSYTSGNLLTVVEFGRVEPRVDVVERGFPSISEEICGIEMAGTYGGSIARTVTSWQSRKFVGSRVIGIFELFSLLWLSRHRAA